MTLEPLDALSRLAARRFASFADAANAVLDLLAGAVPGGCVLLGQVDWDAGECRVLDARGGAVERGSSLPLSAAAEGAGLIGAEALAEVCPGAWVTAPLDAADGSVVALLIASPGAEVAPPRYLSQLLLVAARILSYEWESISTRAELHRLAEAVRDREHTEPVTGLPNREALLEALEREWELSRRGSVESYVVVAHLHDHRAVAEQHGDALADLILKDVAEVFTGAVRRADHLAQVDADAAGDRARRLQGRGGRARLHRPRRALARARCGRAPGARPPLVWDRGAGRDELARRGGRAGRGRGACRRAVLDRVARGGRVSAEPAAATAPVVAAGGLSGPGISPPSLNGAGRRFLSDILVELGFVDQATAEQAVEAARRPGMTPERVLLENRAITQDQLSRALAERYALDHIDLDEYPVDRSAAGLLRETAARRYLAAPIGFADDGALVVAIADPTDSLGLSDIAVMTKLAVRPAVAARAQIEKLVDELDFMDEPEPSLSQASGTLIQPPDEEAGAPMALVDASSGRVEELEGELASREKAHQAELSELRHAAEKAVAAAQVERERALATAQAELEKALAIAAAQREKALAEGQAEYERTLRAERAALAKLEQQLEAERSRAAKAVKDARDAESTTAAKALEDALASERAGAAKAQERALEKAIEEERAQAAKSLRKAVEAAAGKGRRGACHGGAAARRGARKGRAGVRR